MGIGGRKGVGSRAAALCVRLPTSVLPYGNVLSRVKNTQLYYLAQSARTPSMSSAPRSGQAAVSVAGGWLAGGSAVSQRVGGHNVAFSHCPKTTVFDHK